MGAGTMGAGIAQVACLAGFETYLSDPFPDALRGGVERVHAGLARGAERGRWSVDEADTAAKRLRAVEDLGELAPCELAIEAAPEDLDLKRELFSKLADICGPQVLLATNTSSLPVTAIAAGAPRPQNVIGMHFFNPPPLMKLLEVVAGSESADEAVAIARSIGEQMGKQVIVAADGPGFLANRCARPFGLEGLRLLSERIASHATIDRIVRMGGGFRMGPFELADLVGVDVGLEVSKSFYEQSFHEPRWRPSPIQARMVEAGRFGRKVGRGYYDYGRQGGHRDADPQPPQAGGSGTVTVAGSGRLAQELRELAAQAGYEVRAPGEAASDDVEIRVDATLGRFEPGPERLTQEGEVPTCILCAGGSLAELDKDGTAVGFHALPPLSESSLVELTRSSTTTDTFAERIATFFGSLGKHVEWVGDAPGLVLGRIVCQLVNEACFAVSEGVGSPADADAALRLGFNHPRGPLEWADMIGPDQVLATLDALHEERHEERYRVAPLLRRMVAGGKLGGSAGEGLFGYE